MNGKKYKVPTMKQINKIVTLREALKNVLIPLTEEENKRMLSNSGFKNVECFWRCLNFVGFVCIK